MVLIQTFGPMVIAVVFAVFTIIPLRWHMGDNKKYEHTIPKQFDLALMLAMPVTAFLVAESCTISGLLTLVWLCGLLRLYAKPNLTRERHYYLKVGVTSCVHMFKQVAYTFMGFSLPLHLAHTETQYVTAMVTIIIKPLLTTGSYSILNILFKRKPVVNWLRLSS